MVASSQPESNQLIAANIDSLRRALRLLEQLDDRLYTASPQGFAPHRVGSHLRHILEFYECLLDGIESGQVDYDARKRDASVEASRSAAMARIQHIVHRLRRMSTPLHTVIRVCAEEAPETVVTSLGRELQVLSSHTVHHFALIAMTLLAHGFAIDPDFGMAPSTLRYLRKQRDAA